MAHEPEATTTGTFTTHGNMLALSAEPLPVDGPMVHHLQTLLAMAECGMLRWAYICAQTGGHQIVVRAGGNPPSASAAAQAMHEATTFVEHGLVSVVATRVELHADEVKP